MRLSRRVFLSGFVAIGAFGQDSDDALYDAVNRALVEDRHLGAHPLTVDVKDGAVVVSGWVTNEKLRKRVDKIAGKVKGVKSVDNRVQIRP